MVNREGDLLGLANFFLLVKLHTQLNVNLSLKIFDVLSVSSMASLLKQRG